MDFSTLWIGRTASCSPPTHTPRQPGVAARLPRAGQLRTKKVLQLPRGAPHAQWQASLPFPNGRRSLRIAYGLRRRWERIRGHRRRQLAVHVWPAVNALAHPFLISSITQRLPLDKSEGVVKTEISWAVREHRFLCQRRLRTKTLEIAR